MLPGFADLPADDPTADAPHYYMGIIHRTQKRLAEARELMGDDFWSYGLAANRKTLETFLRHHHSQGLSSRLVTPEEMFHPGTLESFKL